MPFTQAAAMLERFTQVSVSKATAQRHTEAIGMAYEAVQCAAVETIERDWPQVEAGPEKLLLSADGAMVALEKASGLKSRHWWWARSQHRQNTRANRS